MRTHFLDIPFEMRGSVPKGATYSKTLKVWTYEGDTLPESLAPYRSPDYSLLRWREDQYNRKILPVKSHEHRFTPRPHQKEAALAIAKEAVRGHRGFIEGDGTGIGKTLASIYGIYGSMKARKQRTSKVLVLCPKAAIGQWTNTFKAFPVPGARICIVNYDQAAKLLKAPASAKTVKRAKTKKAHTMTRGTPTVDWDYIVADESQKLKNWETAARAKAFGQIAKYQEATGFPFVIWASATIGQNPLELQYLFPLLKQITKDRHSMTWFDWLTKHGFAVRKTKTGSVVQITPDKKTPTPIAARMEADLQADLNRMNKMLFSSTSPSIRRTPVDIAGWPEINRIAMGSDLSAAEYIEYQKEWLLFRADRSMLLRGKNPKSALTRQLRFRQKSSWIRHTHTLDHVHDLLENGYQVAVYCEFMETVDAMKQSLEKKGVKVAEYTGRNEADRESERVAFQKGHRKVMLFSVDMAVSFHAEETLPDGSKASSAPRATIMHDLPYSGIKATQVEGRCHRDGKFAPVYFMYAANTTEKRVAEKMVSRIQGIVSIMDDEKFASELDSLLAE